MSNNRRFVTSYSQCWTVVHTHGQRWELWVLLVLAARCEQPGPGQGVRTPSRDTRGVRYPPVRSDWGQLLWPATHPWWLEVPCNTCHWGGRRGK